MTAKPSREGSHVLQFTQVSHSRQARDGRDEPAAGRYGGASDDDGGRQRRRRSSRDRRGPQRGRADVDRRRGRPLLPHLACQGAPRRRPQRERTRARRRRHRGRHPHGAQPHPQRQRVVRLSPRHGERLGHHPSRVWHHVVGAGVAARNPVRRGGLPRLGHHRLPVVDGRGQAGAVPLRPGVAPERPRSHGGRGHAPARAWRDRSGPHCRRRSRRLLPRTHRTEDRRLRAGARRVDDPGGPGRRLRHLGRAHLHRLPRTSPAGSARPTARGSSHCLP